LPGALTVIYNPKGHHFFQHGRDVK
jgi:hypothetical protein